MTIPFKFPDCRTPARLANLFRDEVISSKDLLLLWTIEALIRSPGNTTGRGCWATNAYLAEAINAGPMYVSARISRLKKMGLLFTVEFDGRRYVEVEWMRTAEERAAFPGPYGKQLRVEHAALCKRARPLMSEEEGGNTGTLPKGNTGTLPGVTLERYQNNQIDPNTQKKETHCCGGGRNGAREPFGKAKLPPTPRKYPKGQPPVQPTGNGRATFLNGTTPRSEEERLASKLFKAIDGASKVQRSADMTKWAVVFREFIPKVKGGRAHFVRVLDWYCANVGRRFTPAAYSAKTFCDKFDNIVRSMQVQAQAARKDDGGRRKNSNDYLDDNFIPPDDDNLLPPDQRW